MVGDALGRPNDHSDCDLKFAENIGIKILSPEIAFLFESIKKIPKTTQEIIIMVGFPGSGKTYLSKEIFGKAGYFIAHGD